MRKSALTSPVLNEDGTHKAVGMAGVLAAFSFLLLAALTLVGRAQTSSSYAVSVSAPVSGQVIAGTFDFVAVTTGLADSVVFEVTPGSGTNLSSFRMTASRDTIDPFKWKYSVYTSALPNGTYSFLTKAYVGATAVAVAPAYSFSVSNTATVSGGSSTTDGTTSGSSGSSTSTDGTVSGSGSSSSTSTDTSSYTGILGVGIAAPSGGATVSGSTVLSAETSVAADIVKFRILNASGYTVATLDGVPDGAKTIWKATWETGNYAAGDYTIYAGASKGTTFVESFAVRVKAAVPTTTANDTATASASVAMTSPKAGSTVSGYAVFSATVTGTAESLEFFIKDSAGNAGSAKGYVASGSSEWSANVDLSRFAAGEASVYAKATVLGTAVHSGAVAFIIAAKPAETTVQAAPTIGFAAPTEGAALTGASAISVKADAALALVEIAVYSEEFGRYVEVKRLPTTSPSAGLWTASWDTKSVADGNYVLAASGKTSAGASYGASIKVAVKNSTTAQEAAATSDAVPELAVKLAFPTGGETFAGGVRTLKATTSAAAESLEFVISSSATSGSGGLRATKAEDGLVWTASMDTGKMPAGGYSVTAKAMLGGRTYASETKKFFVAQAETSTTTAATETVPEIAKIPALAMTSPAYGTVARGDITLSAKANGTFSSVVFQVYARGDASAVATITASLASTGLWRASFATAGVKDGDYHIVPIGRYSTGEVRGTAVLVTVLSTVETTTSVPKETWRAVAPEDAAAISQTVPEGTEVIIADKEEEVVVTRLAPECVAAGVTGSRCDALLAVKYGRSECATVGIITKEECIAFLLRTRTEGGACGGTTEAQCRDIAAKKSAGLISVERYDAVSKSAGEAVGSAITLKETVGEQRPDAPKQASPELAASIPLRDDSTLRVHAAAAFSKIEDDTSVRAIPALILLDADADGLPDDAEARIGTDPHVADTDGDGFSDWTEVRNGFDPLSAGTGKATLALAPVDIAVISGAPFEQPKSVGKIDETLVVESVSTDKKDGKDVVVLSGKAEPGAVVTIFVYSYLPLVLTTTADASGNWSYELEGSLVDGEHEVYATVTDETGKIEGKGNPLAFFVAEAQAVSPTEFAATATATSVAEEPLRGAMLWYFAGVALLLVVASALAFALYRQSRK